MARRLLALIVVSLSCLAPSAAAAAEIVNGGFESGDFSGWEVRHVTGFGNWYAYQGTEPLIAHERGATSVQPPPQGAYAAMTDQLNPESLFLSQDIRLEPGSRYKLSLLAYYDSYAALTVPSPDFLAVDPEAPDARTNQQFRIDLMRPDAPLDSLDPSDVLLNLLQTRGGGARKMEPTRILADLAPFAGQTVRLRIAVVATEEVLNGGVDAIALSAPDGTFPQSQLRRIHPLKPKANLRNGTVVLPVRVPEAGRLTAQARSGKVRPAAAKTARAGVVKLHLRTSAKGHAILERRHKLRVGMTLVWRPLSGGRAKLRVPVVFRLRTS